MKWYTRRSSKAVIQSVAVFFMVNGFVTQALNGMSVQDITNKAPRLGEPAGVENPLLTPEEGQAICCPLPRDVNITGDLFVAGTITGSGPIIIPGLGIGVVESDGSGLLSTENGTAGQILTANGPGLLPTFQAAAGTSISITGDTGGALVSGSFTFTGGTTGLVFNGAGTTETLGGTLVVANGGTGVTSFTPFALLAGGTTSTNPIQSIVSVGTAGQVLTSNGAGALPTFQSPAASSITITGDTGGGLVGTSFTFTGGTTGLVFNGAGTTETLGGTLVVANGGTGATTLTGILRGNGASAITANPVTQFNVLVGGASNAITSIAPSATSGVPLVSQGAAANPAFGTAVVAGGGTGTTSFTPYAVLAGGTTATNPVQSIASVGTAGQVLTSNGAGALPTFQSVSSGGAITTINGNAGSVAPTAGAVTISGGSNITTSGAGSTLTVNLISSPSVTGSLTAGTTVTAGFGITSTSGNIVATGGQVNAGTTMTAGTGITATTGDIVATAGKVIGGTGVTATSGNVTLTAGNLVLPDTTSSTVGVIVSGGLPFIHTFGVNIFVGANAGNFTLSGINNIGIGSVALQDITSGNFNVAVGQAAGSNLQTGSNNTFIGINSGASYTAGEASNICIGAQQTGVAGESNTARIGALGSITRCFIQGIRGVTTDIADAVTVLIDSAGQLGTVSSSRRYKENIVDLADLAQKFMQLRPVMFNYKSDESKAQHYGLIAEEVEALYPELVVYNNDGQAETIKYHLLYALLIKMIQDNRKLAEENRQLIQNHDELIDQLFVICGIQKKVAC